MLSPSLKLILLVCAVIAIVLLLVWRARDTSPTDMPQDLRISYSHNAGELPDREMYNLAIGASTATIHRGVGDGTDYAFAVTETEMKDLYRMLRAQQFSTIKTNDGDIEHDAAETNLAVTWGDQKVELRNGSRTRVTESTAERFFAITAALDAFVEQKIGSAAFLASP